MTTAGLFRRMGMPSEGNIIHHEEVKDVSSRPYIRLEDVEFAIYLLEDRGDPTEAYEFLEHNSKDGYSKLAGGVARGDSIFGKGAVNYLKNKAEKYNIDINDDYIKSILKDMGDEYFNLLKNKVLNSPYGFIDSNINHKEVYAIHETVFKKHGLPIEAWTLEPVFKVTPENERERDWQDMLGAAGEPWSELKIANKIRNKMIDKLLSGPESEKKGISDWVDSTVTFNNAGAVVSVLTDEMTKDLPMTVCFPDLTCEIRRYNFVENFVFDNRELFNIGEFSYNAPMPSRYLTDYHMDRPSYGLPESGLFGGSSYNSPFNSSFSPSSGIDRLANMMSSNRSLGEFGFGDFYSPSRSFDFGSNLSFGGFGHRW